MSGPIKAVVFVGGDDLASEWRISWVPGHPMFEIESLNCPNTVIVRWRVWSVVTNDTVGDDHARAYEYAEELFGRCIAGEIPYEGS